MVRRILILLALLMVSLTTSARAQTQGQGYAWGFVYPGSLVPLPTGGGGGVTPNSCSSNQYATGIGTSSGTLVCSLVSASQISGLGPLATQSTPCTLSQGCTGATTAAAARTNLGLGTAAIQNALTGTAPINITAGTNPVASLTSPVNGYDVNEVVSVLAHGAKCDGHTDDTTADQASITAACVAGAGQVIFPPGAACVISSTLTVPCAVDIHGAGSGTANAGSTTLETTSANLPIFSVTAPAAIHDVTLDRSATATAGGDGIDVQNGILGANLWNLVVQDQWNGISVGSVAYGFLNQSVLQNNYNTGFLAASNAAGGGGLQWQIDNVLSQLNNGYGFYFQNLTNTPMTAGAPISNITAFANTLGGIVFQGNGVGAGIGDIQGTNWFLGEDGQYGLFLDTDNASNNRIANVSVEFIGEAGTGRHSGTPATNTGWGIAQSATSPTVPTLLTGIWVVDSAYDGIINQGSYETINGCVLQDNGAHGVGSTQDAGIVTAGGVTNIEACKFFDSGSSFQQYGLSMVGGTVYATGGDWSGNHTASTTGALVGSFCNVNGVSTGVCYPGTATNNTSVNQVLNPMAPAVLVAGTSSTYLTAGALANNSNDDTVPIDNAVMAAEGITTPSGSISAHSYAPRVYLPLNPTSTSNCYFHTQPIRLLGPNLDFGGETKQPLAATPLCQNYIGFALDQEAWGANNLTYVAGLVGGGTAMSNASNTNNIALSDMMNSGLYHLNQATAFDVSGEINAASYNGNDIWGWHIGQPVGANGGANNDQAHPAAFQPQSNGKVQCIIYTTGSGRVAGLSSDTGFTGGTNHFWRYDYDGSDLRCYRDGNLVVGPLAATGKLYSSVASGSGTQDISEMPDGGAGFWPHDYGTSGVAATYDIFDAENQSCITAGNCTTVPAAKVTTGAHTILAVNFESTCSGEGVNTGCSLDGFQLAHTGLYNDGSGTARVYLKVYGQSGNTTAYDHIHNLSMCVNSVGGMAGADGLFSIQGNNSEYDHLNCSGFNNRGFDLSYDFESWFHDNTAISGAFGYGLCAVFGPHYGESWNSHLYCDSAAVEDVHYSDEWSDDNFFQFAGRGGGVIQSIYTGTQLSNEDEFNDLETTDTDWITNEYLASAYGKFTSAQLDTRNGAPYAIEVGNGQTGVTWDNPLWGTFAASTPPAEYISHETLQSSIQTPTGPDVIINPQPVCETGGSIVTCFQNNGVPTAGAVEVPLTLPAGWAKDSGDAMSASQCPQYAISSASAGTYLNAPLCNAGSAGNSLYLLDCAACTAGTSCASGGSSGHPCMASCNGTNYVETGIGYCIGG